MYRRLTAVIAMCAALCGAPVGNVVVTGAAQAAAPTTELTAPSGRISDRAVVNKRWNVVVVLTDDQNRDLLADMPNVRRFLIRRGVAYPNAVVPTSTCCPSRASLLTGWYVGGHGVQDNDSVGVPGGYRAFRMFGNEQHSLAVLLRRAGYTTGLFGKYFNQYGDYFRRRKPPGWDAWRPFTTSPHGGAYRGFRTTTADGEHKRSVKAYSTTWLGQRTAEFIRRAPKQRPVFALYAPYAPHGPALARAQYRGSVTDDGWWQRNPAFQEPDVSDKPLYVQRQKTTPHKDYAQLVVRQRETLRHVDDEVGRLVAALRATGRWQRTLFVFMSDNGVMHGIHRIRSKHVPYRNASDVPLIVRYGRDRRARTDSRVVAANVDLTATILGVAGIRRRSDGVPLTGRPGRDGVPLQGAQRDSGRYTSRPPYCGWRTATDMFARYGSGEEEYYDYATDPYELDNRVADPAVAARVAVLRRAAARACDPTPAGFGPSFYEPTWVYGERTDLPPAPTFD